MNMSENTKNNNDLDCPDLIKSYNLKCEQCDLIPNFTLYNYKDIKLNIIWNNGHSDNLNLNEYIKKKSNINNESLCSKCNNKKTLNYCQFCNKYLCQKCQLNHFSIEHIFKNEQL